MGTRLRTGVMAMALAVAASACGVGQPSAGHSPTPSASIPTRTSAPPSTLPTATSQPAGSAYGVLVISPDPSNSTYTVSIVRTNGTVAASKTFNAPTAPSCGGVTSALTTLPFSTSDSGVYYLDNGSEVWFLAPDGSLRQVTSVPAASASRSSTFSVSPDDKRIAVVVEDFTASGASTRLYVEDLNGGGNHIELFSETGAYTIWPIGWHTTQNLILAKEVSCVTGAVDTGAPIEYHVVDPATANRRFTVGGTGCYISRPGAPSPAGVICESPPTATALSWSGTTIGTYPIQGAIGAYLSPDGSNVAFVDRVGTTFSSGDSALADVFVCAWIDESHVLAGDLVAGSVLPQLQAKVVDLTSHRVTVVAARGICAGRVPGGL